MRAMTTELKSNRALQYTYLRYVLAVVALLMTGAVFMPTAHAAEEDGGEESHAMFDFSAYISHDEIIDGTDLNETMDRKGYDNSPNNGVIRSFDTISYPLRITVNPKGVDVLEDIELEITGTLENGITDGRANARFAVDGTEDMETETVSFKQKYTIERTGSAIMFPVTVEVLAAEHGVKLTPDIQVQVVSVGGKDIRDDKVITEFNNIPATEVTADVSIKPEMRRGIGALGIPYYPIQNITGDTGDLENLHMFTVAWGIDNLPGVSSNKGATFPDPDGVIDYDIDLSGFVSWESGPNSGKQTPLTFTEGKDAPFKLFDHRDNSSTLNSVGSANTVSDGMDYHFEHANINNAPYSKMPDLEPKTIEKHRKGTVWDSGDWSVDKPAVDKHTVSYSGTNTDYVIGSTFPEFGGYTQYRKNGGVSVADNLFSTQTFIVQLANEYFIGGGRMNPDNYGNIVNYDASVTLNSYTAPNGDTVTFDKTTEVDSYVETNSADGNFTFYNDFAAYPSGEQLGTYLSNMGSISKGNAYTLIGEDVQFRARLQSNVAFRGGARLMYHWNTDAFRLTEEYAERAERSIMRAGYESYAQERVRNDESTQNVLYGVPKSNDNSFKALRLAHHDDYTWYESFKEAQDAGKVGAILNDITASMGATRYPQVNIPLRVLHNNIGVGSTAGEDDTANIAVLSPYGYMDADREMEVDISKHASLGNPAIWNDRGVMEKIQSPVRGYSNFETLAIIPAEVSTNLSTERQTYYNSEAVEWKSESDVNLPQGAMPADYDPGVRVYHELPEGLDYVQGSGEVDGEKIDPQIDDVEGKRVLVWDVMISNEDTSIPDVTFETTINNKALGDGAQSSASIRSVIESDLDSRAESFRSSTHSVTITKVGMVGVREQVDPLSGTGPKGSEYTLNVSPYTTIEEEPGVAGVKVLPHAGDSGGSDYSGTAKFTKIHTVARGGDIRRNDVDIYVNDSVVETDKPHKIDYTKNGWRKYSGPEDLENAVSVAFKVDGMLTSKDDVTIRITIDTDGNDFGDVYANETVVNSDRNHEASPVSRVLYKISPDLALRLDRFQIYTHKGELPSFTRVHQVIGAHIEDESAVEDLNMTLGIYDTDTGDKVTEKVYSQPEIESENRIDIPVDDRQKGDVSNYEVRIEDYDTDRVWVQDGMGEINTDGHVSREDVLDRDDVDEESGLIEFSGVTMTERERGKDMVTFNESLTVDPFDGVKVKSGYGFALDGSVSYENKLMDQTKAVIPDIAYDTNAYAALDRALVDESLSFYDADKDVNRVMLADGSADNPEMGDDPEPEANTVMQSYTLPETYMAKGDGLTYTAEQVAASDDLSIDTMLAGGNQFFVPVWIDGIDVYNAGFVSERAIGSHLTTFNVGTPIDVHAYMLHHIDSESGDKDELLIRPVERDGLPEFWQTDEDGNKIE